MKINKICQKDLIKIIDKFGQDNRIFQSEAQFQFDLAWEIRNNLHSEKTEIRLEEMTVQEKNSNKRFYSDIVIKYNDKSFDVIELKYKTKASTYIDRNKTTVSLLNHGARDLGRYDYLYDLYRMQLLKKQDIKKYSYPLDYSFNSGYAIILTNDYHYWEQTKSNVKDVLYKNFCIGEGDVIKERETLEWNSKKVDNCIKGTWRDKGLQFDNTYKCEWRDYYTCSRDSFKFLILEI